MIIPIISGTAFGTAGGIGATAGAIALGCTPLGWVAFGAGLVGGGISGFYGTKVGDRVEKCIWDEGESHINHVYEFFAIKTEKPRQILTGEELIQKHNDKLKLHCNDEGWKNLCKSHLFFLMQNMSPTLKIVLNETKTFQERLESRGMEENAATILAELFYDQVMDNTHPENVFVSSDDFQDVYLP